MPGPDHTQHPSVAHHRRAARSLREAAQRHEDAATQHERGDHPLAHGLASRAKRDVAEAEGHAREAERLHHDYRAAQRRSTET
jgi:hypothetical protein